MKEKDNQMLRAKLLKLRTQVGKYESSLDKLKTRGPGMFSGRMSTASVGSISVKSNDYGQTSMARPQSAASIASGSVRGASPVLPRSNFSSGGRGAASNPADDDGEENVTKESRANVEADAELKGLWEEHEVLQNVRRSLVGRAKSAKKKYDESIASCAVFAKLKALCERRMHYFTNGVSFLEGFEMKVDPSDADYQLFEKFQASLRDLMRAQGYLDECIHLLAVESSEAELQAVVKSLRRQKDRLRTEVDKMKEQKERNTAGLRLLIESNRVYKMRDFISFMRTLLLRFERNERIADCEDEFNTVQLELIKLQHRQLVRNEEKMLSSYS